jgi:hypothetical protein
MTGRKEIGLGGTTGVALAGCMAVVAAVILVPCWAGAEEARSSAQEAGPPGAKGSGAEPEFRPGIPGLKIVDVRDHKFLWREIEELQIWERGDRISIAEYRSKVIEKTAHFLGLGGAAADEFAAAASGAVATIRESFHQTRRVDGDLSAAEAQFSADMSAAVARISSLLKKEPRHQLFAPDCKKWLLRLAFGPKEAKEAREAEKAQADKSGTAGSG